MKVQAGEQELYMDGYLKNNLDLASDVIKKDWDMVFVVDGLEGSGKSVLAQQMAKYLDPSLSIDRITFNPSDFRDAILKANKYEAVIYDEAYGGLASRQSMSIVNKALVSMMAQIRQKNLYVFVVLPCFFELDKYVGVWRSRALVHVYISDNFERGYFAFYNSSKKKSLYMYGKKFYEYKVAPNFRGRFVKGYTVNEEAYREKKMEALTVPDNEYEESYRMQRDSLIRVCSEKGWTHEDIAKSIGRYSMVSLSRCAITKVITRSKEKSPEIGSNQA